MNKRKNEDSIRDRTVMLRLDRQTHYRLEFVSNITGIPVATLIYKMLLHSNVCYIDDYTATVLKMIQKNLEELKKNPNNVSLLERLESLEKNIKSLMPNLSDDNGRYIVKPKIFCVKNFNKTSVPQTVDDTHECDCVCEKVEQKSERHSRFIVKRKDIVNKKKQ